jgi:hypothetical protein
VGVYVKSSCFKTVCIFQHINDCSCVLLLCVAVAVCCCVAVAAVAVLFAVVLLPLLLLLLFARAVRGAVCYCGVLPSCHRLRRNVE